MPTMLSDGPTRRLALRKLVAWFAIGVIVAVFLQWLQVRALGGDWTGLVNAGQQSALRPLIEAELGPVQTVDQAGHDGQYSFLIARDPLGQGGAPELFDHGAYRYRRILMPLLGGGFGQFDGTTTLFGLVVWSAIGMGLATAALADLGAAFGARPWVVAGVLANPGVWLSVQLLTPDVLALGWALTGITLWLRDHRWWSIAALAAAALTKDQYLLVALALAAFEWWGGHRRQASILAAGAMVPIAAWSIWLTFEMGEGLTPRGNFSLPLLGIFNSAGRWAESGSKDLIFTVISIGALVVAVVLPFFTRVALIRWLAWTWVGLAVVSSGWVWNLGNNSLRVFAPLATFGVLALATARAGRSETGPGT